MFHTRFSFLGRIVAAAAAAFSVAMLVAACSSTQTVQSAVSSSSSDASSDGKISVVASFYPMADFAQKIGGDKVNVRCLVPAGSEPHDWEPTPEDIQAIDAADLLVYNGAGMESWVDDVISSSGADAPQSVCASDGIVLRQVMGDEGDEAGKLITDPHVWNSPKNAEVELRNIANALEAVDPDNKDYYEANYQQVAAECEQLDSDFSQTLSACSKKEIVVSHEAWGYLCDAYGLTEVGIAGLDPEAEPDAQSMAEISDKVRDDGVTTIFYEDLASPKVAQAIASETGASVERLNPLEGLTDDELAQGEDYFSVMRSNLEELRAALS